MPRWLHYIMFALFLLTPTASPYTLCAIDLSTVHGPAVVVRSNGFVVSGTLLSIDSSHVTLKSPRALAPMEFRSSSVRQVRIGGDVLIYNREKHTFESQMELDNQARAQQMAREQEAQRRRRAEEAARSGRLKIINNTDKSVAFVITRIRDSEGIEVVLDDGRSKSNAEEIAGAIDAMFGEGKSSRPTAMRWTVQPRATVFLTSSDGNNVITSKVDYTLTTSDGSRSWGSEKKTDSEDFVISIDESDLHTPVLANIGEFHVEQDISYTTHRARTPTGIHPVTGFFSGKVEYYEVIGGDEYDYTREHRSGYATAWAEVENPTDRTLEVTATVEFHFTHLLLSNERVEATISVKPKTKTKMFINVNTKAFVDNRKATSVRLIDVTTTVK